MNIFRKRGLTFSRLFPATWPPSTTDFRGVSAVFRRSGIPGAFLHVPFLYMSFWRLTVVHENVREPRYDQAITLCTTCRACWAAVPGPCAPLKLNRTGHVLVPLASTTLGFAIVPPVPDRFSWVGFGPVLAASLVRTDQKPVPKLVPETLRGDRKHYCVTSRNCDQHVQMLR